MSSYLIVCKNHKFILIPRLFILTISVIMYNIIITKFSLKNKSVTQSSVNIIIIFIPKLKKNHVFNSKICYIVQIIS